MSGAKNENGYGKLNNMITIAVLIMSTAGLGISGTNYYTSQVIDAKFEEEKQERKDDIEQLDTTLQRETRLLDDRILERLAALEHQFDIRFDNSLGNDLDVLTREQRIRTLEQENSAQKVQIEELKARLAKLEAKVT